MSDNIKEILLNFFKSRLFVLGAVMVILCGILIQHVFVLQIINGEEYQSNYTLRIEKERELKSTRGNIYDRNGKLLAYNELAYTVTIEDNGSYDTTSEKNEYLNQVLAEIITEMDKNGDDIDNDFQIVQDENGSYDFGVDGTSRRRFLADVYGHSSVDDLKYNTKIGYNEGEATAEQVMQYLMSERKFGVSSNYEPAMAYRIVVVRYALSQNSYQKYISTTIATDVSEETVSYVAENANHLQGVEVSEDTIRKYNDAEYFAQIIGYTGKISQEEYDTLSEDSDLYSLTDVIGKAGMEQYMDSTLQGTKGSEVVYVDNLGKVIETKSRMEPAAGNDVYLSIDADVQEATYRLLEQELAGILYDKIENITDYDVSNTAKASDIIIPIDDVYFALLNNNLIDIEHFDDADASTAEQNVQSIFLSRQAAVFSSLQSEMNSSAPTPFSVLPEESQDYITYIISMLRDYDILLNSNIDRNDATYKAWADGTISLEEYLQHAIEQQWIDITQFDVDEQYADSNEIYSALVTFIMDELSTDKAFSKLIYKYIVDQGGITGTQLCLILFDQGILKDEDGTAYAALQSGTTSPYNFLKDKIRNLEITPAQLALDPCSASTVITNTSTGELLAVVSYPGYDNNRLANTVDSEYYAQLTEDLSNPLYNYATQERTAPGSTFKMLSATAGLAENIISTDTYIQDRGEFTIITPSPKCWAYPSTHGSINVSEAIRDSCNYFFYQVGYDLSMRNGSYNDKQGIDAIQKYAELYGLNETTGIEITENKSNVATEDPVRAAIGQSNNNYTTTQIARYVTAVANSGTVYNDTLLSKVTDSSGKTLEDFSPTVRNQIDVLDASEWDAIHYGMRRVATEELDTFRDFPVSVAGKTGTAQTIRTRANHALFVGYAPYENPEVSIVTRIAYGYTSHNAADVAKQILSYYFKIQTEEELLSGQATDVADSSNVMAD